MELKQRIKLQTARQRARSVNWKFRVKVRKIHAMLELEILSV